LTGFAFLVFDDIKCILAFMKKLLSTVLILFSLSLFAGSQTFEEGTTFQVAFSPKGECQDIIVNAINKAQKTILVQSYSFTSAPIAKALMKAHKRGVDAKVILDKSQVTQKYSSATFLKNQKIPLWIDYKPAIAHNKVMIIDSHIVITGSFNFTKAAQEKNAENVLVIHSKKLAKIYKECWNDRLSKSKPYSEYKKQEG
jgi:phosphatidylserine/phosphatidylglycerophosphate/cardiolipin synthase-like enzyme